MKIAIISSSVRTGRNSQRVALFFKNYMEKNGLVSITFLDLDEYKFPIFEERLRNMVNPLPQAVAFAEKIKLADGVIIVTPEYNGGYPSSLKNVIDLLYVEWKRKPIAIATVSTGSFGGAQVITSLVFTLWKIGALMVPASYYVPKVQEAYSEDGTPVNKEEAEKRAGLFVDELLWAINLNKPAALFAE